MAVARQERLELHVLDIGLKIVIELSHVEVTLSIVELIHVVLKVPLREVLPKPELASFEWLVVYERKHLLLCNCTVNQLAPDGFV